MSQYSFYGGKQGRTYNLVYHFDSIYDMVKLFQNGGSFNTVNYNEYVIIDTLAQKNEKYNRENGIIYRRGMNFSEVFNPKGVGLTNNTLSEFDTVIKTIYATNLNTEYLDTDNITSGYSVTTEVPKYKHFAYTIKRVEGVLIAEIKPRDFIIGDVTSGQTLFSIDWQNFVFNPGGGAEYVGQIVGPQGSSPEIAMDSWDDFIENYMGGDAEGAKGELFADFHPGIIEEQGGRVLLYDNIQYGYCNILDQYGNIEGAMISLDIPTKITKVNAYSVSPYGPIIKEVSVLPVSNILKEVFYKVGNKYYIWNEDRLVEDPNSDGYPPIYNKSPGFVEVTPSDWWTKEGTTYPYTYNHLIREKSDSKGHPFFKDYEIAVPKGIHGVDSDIEVTNNFNIVRTLRNYDQSMEGSESSTILRGLTAIESITPDIVQGNRSFIDINYYVNHDISQAERTVPIAFPAISHIEVSNDHRLDLTSYYQYYYTFGNESRSATQQTPYPVNEVIAIKVVQNVVCALFSDPTYRQNLSEDTSKLATFENGTEGWTYTKDDRGITGGDQFRWAEIGSIEGKNTLYKNYSSLAALKSANPYGFGRDSQGQIIPDEIGMIGMLAVVTTQEGDTEKVESYYYDYNGTAGNPDNWKKFAEAVSGVIDQPGNIMIASIPNPSQPEYPDEGDSLLHQNGFWFVIEDK